MKNRILVSALLALALLAPPSLAQDSGDSWLPSLLTETPAQGFDLAVTMARKGVTTTQGDKEVLFAVRPNYARDPQSLIDVSGVIAMYFATIAEANDHWEN
ncbi:hypothetical protein Dshi_0225 [Dinoroseobacter shibae DFL 12 = DSM 16493]|jgi:hypothetical protein|uniref:Hexameric tyrosine-coordinated heme protein (HTHP) n=1 Tax=Dinoroseobacter shibae (strain DSM 16493 / NCIMB 14021 / DFL 12) TaxID=398580 RepID=A8LLG4_DINSH|nr:hexameric tyrosine-coordinated heme protein [Dinoroseobacter shibae]ABV91974.1 hypothetical protein Dshi_0225 [Dinoroseobacter shibae DFL 12 = DSM 16493]URF46946.1 hexameric tyrosine-coordinated heme protein [Dinoroseobacter shibae]URF51257.1 hexameric tyrosine-coordinated heme protein [Dinoroseobacter shibae]